VQEPSEALQQGEGDAHLYLDSVKERQAELDSQGTPMLPEGEVQKKTVDDPMMPALERVGNVEEAGEDGDLNELD